MSSFSICMSKGALSSFWKVFSLNKNFMLTGFCFFQYFEDVAPLFFWLPLLLRKSLLLFLFLCFYKIYILLRAFKIFSLLLFTNNFIRLFMVQFFFYFSCSDLVEFLDLWLCHFYQICNSPGHYFSTNILYFLDKFCVHSKK